MSSYSLIDDDHIDDQETINVGNLIIDLESDLEKEKIENEQANAKPTTQQQQQQQQQQQPTSTTSAIISNNEFNDPTAIISTINNSNGQQATTNRTTYFKTTADERGELKMRITRETKPGRSEHKITTSPTGNNSGTTIDSANINNNIINNSNSQFPVETAKTNNKTSTSISSTKECGTSTSIGTITEPDCLGPCEPGTSVTLEGIVWQETEGGILVVNVTWRGKTYVGALLDCTKHDWAPPRLCDSPASDIDSKATKGVRTKRIVTRSNGIGIDEKNLLQTTGKLRNGKGRRILSSNELAPSNKRQKESEKASNESTAAQAGASDPSPATNVASINTSEITEASASLDATSALNNQLTASTSDIPQEKAGPDSPLLIGCNEPNCSKKYRNVNGLLYHQAAAHGPDNEQSTSQDNSCSPSITKDKNTVSSKPINVDPITESNAQPLNHGPTPVPLAASIPVSTPHPHFIPDPISPREDEKNKPSNSIPCRSQELPLAPSLKQISSKPKHESSPMKAPIKVNEIERRHSINSNTSISNNNSSSRTPGSSSSKQPSDEGMKPSGTSTGPPPPPHQANCYFNQSFLNSALNSTAALSLPPYSFFNRPPIPMFDPANAAFMSRFMRPPAPESPSRLLSPSMARSLPPLPPGSLPMPTSQMPPNSLPNVSPLMSHPPMATGSPLLRLPGDPLLPPPPYPMNMNPGPLGLPPNPLGPLGSMGGPPVPNLIDDPLAKQFQRRYN